MNLHILVRMSNLNWEHDRFKTFNNLSTDERKSQKLTRSDFFYTNYKAHVRCYFCSLEMSALKCPSDVEAEHIRLSPKCSYASGEDTCKPYERRNN